MTVFKLFGKMQDYLQKADCPNAKLLINDIAEQMWIPLIQGTLRYAWILDAANNEAADVTEKAAAEGAIFAAAILPVIHQCDKDAAQTIYDNMSMKAAVNVDFPAVKAAFEKCYSKIGVSCADVGGVANSLGDSFADSKTKACGGVPFGSAASPIAIGSLVGAAILGVVALLL